MPKKKKKSTATTFLIHWEIPADTPTHYANQLIIQRGEDDCVFRFFELLPPLPDDLVQSGNSAGKAKSIEAKCVAQVVIPMSAVARFSQALSNLASTPEDEAKK